MPCGGQSTLVSLVLLGLGFTAGLLQLLVPYSDVLLAGYASDFIIITRMRNYCHFYCGTYLLRNHLAKIGIRNIRSLILQKLESSFNSVLVHCLMFASCRFARLIMWGRECLQLWSDIFGRLAKP